mgnify:FL=1|jgi:hypothetical protein|tara:strand:+ start:453 stop:1076 length:624 start_codon:yes stop_codon:yes gene_type:complete
MPRVSSLDPLLRDSLDDSDLFIVFDKSEQQDEPLKKISRMELGAAILSAFNESDTLHSVTSRGNTTTNNITVNDALVNGDLTVQGTTTTVNSTEMTVTDKNITLGNGLASSALADGGGITLDGANATIQWSHSSQCWEFSHTLCYPGELETTDSLNEGSLNLYYTKTRVDSDVNEGLNAAFSVSLVIYDSANTALKTIWGSATNTYP